jgi:hypothetical protein
VEPLFHPGSVVDLLADAGQIANSDLFDPAPDALADEMGDGEVEHLLHLLALLAGDPCTAGTCRVSPAPVASPSPVPSAKTAEPP